MWIMLAFDSMIAGINVNLLVCCHSTGHLIVFGCFEVVILLCTMISAESEADISLQWSSEYAH